MPLSDVDRFVACVIFYTMTEAIHPVMWTGKQEQKQLWSWRGVCASYRNPKNFDFSAPDFGLGRTTDRPGTGHGRRHVKRQPRRRFLGHLEKPNSEVKLPNTVEPSLVSYTFHAAIRQWFDWSPRRKVRVGSSTRSTRSTCLPTTRGRRDEPSGRPCPAVEERLWPVANLLPLRAPADTECLLHRET